MSCYFCGAHRPQDTLARSHSFSRTILVMATDLSSSSAGTT
ncbi:hypothetical protein SLNWT_2950 [Streptomyces albus]|uniref:Uncharacterized protein n=1 Tax=Streptomyces albus (strain ATCC 21838 / DSM 41398 / FERM P-419 / JCM 4703 / NBRC 107858) TaxID=1081613 RepID=A0A0B5EXG0_STRA4|nr:hypothetical protein SLNWT_2950 [Streptomyces albus]